MKELAVVFKFLELSSKSSGLNLNFAFTGNEELVHFRQFKVQAIEEFAFK